MNKKLIVPKFKNEDEEREFWAKINLADYSSKKDYERVVFPNLKPTTRPVSIRIPEYLLAEIKAQANELNVPYQSLMKKYIAQGLAKKC